MEANVRLGRIAGIPVGMNWSLLIAFWLIAWNLAAGRFPREAPGHSVAAYWWAAAIAALLFFASLLAHEVGHALLARREGVAVADITLWLFGGVARLQGDVASAAAEARIAVVGPLVSLALAGVFGLVAAGFARAGLPLPADVCRWLAIINAVLAVFNLVPAFPLDGGRVLRALLWQWRGRRTWATAIAARAGRVFGYALIVFGLFELFVGGSAAGLWSVFLGWFLLSAARAEESAVLVQHALAGVRVADVMSPDPVVAPCWLTVDDFLRTYVMQHRFTSFPLHDFGGKLDGLVTLSRLKRVPSEQRATTRVRDVALDLASTPTAGPAEPLSRVLGRLSGDGEQRILVLDEGKLVGIVTPTDVARVLQRASLDGAPRRGGAADDRAAVEQ